MLQGQFSVYFFKSFFESFNAVASIWWIFFVRLLVKAVIENEKIEIHVVSYLRGQRSAPALWEYWPPEFRPILK